MAVLSKLLKRSVSVLVSVALVCAAVATNAGGDAYGRYSGTPTLDHARSAPADLAVRRGSHGLSASTHQLRPDDRHAVIAARVAVATEIGRGRQVALRSARAVSSGATDAHTNRGPPQSLLF